MSDFDPTIDAAFREYADLELRRHHLLLDGKENSLEIADAEDRMYELWTKLDDVQRRSLSGMASDLNWIRRKAEPPPRGRKTPEEVAATERQELSAAMKSREWHRVLHYLRLCAPTFQAGSLARERGIAYDAIGFPEYFRVFDAQARRGKEDAARERKRSRGKEGGRGKGRGKEDAARGRGKEDARGRGNEDAARKEGK